MARCPSPSPSPASYSSHIAAPSLGAAVAFASMGALFALSRFSLPRRAARALLPPLLRRAGVLTTDAARYEDFILKLRVRYVFVATAGDGGGTGGVSGEQRVLEIEGSGGSPFLRASSPSGSWPPPCAGSAASYNRCSRHLTLLPCAHSPQQCNPVRLALQACPSQLQRWHWLLWSRCSRRTAAKACTPPGLPRRRPPSTRPRSGSSSCAGGRRRREPGRHGRELASPLMKRPAAAPFW